MKQRTRTPLCSAIGLFILLLLQHTAPGFCESTEITKNTIRQSIDEHRTKIQRLQKGIEDQLVKSEETVMQEKTVLSELEEIDQRLQSQLEKVNRLERESQLQQELILAKQLEIEALHADRQQVLDHLQKRIGAYYKMGRIGLLNVTFSSQSLPDLLRFQDAFQTLISYDQDVVRRYREKIDELERARDAYTLEREVLQDFITNVRAEQEETDRIRAEKEQLLVHIRTQKHLYDQAVDEMEAAAEKLSAKIINLKKEEELLEQTFLRSKGRLHPPVAGEVITYFNQEKFNKLGILRKSSGISIDAPVGSEVQAVAEGTVIFSGYLRGYGNTVIIHHGFQYFTVTSRLDGIAVSKGDTIKAGAHIGLLSETGTLIDEGLYFEVRHGKESLDPLKWLNTLKLQLTGVPSTTKRG